jgi:VanZ family protein
LIHSPLYPPIIRVLRIALTLAVVWLVLRGEATAAFIVAVFLMLSFAHLLREKPRPNVFDLLFVLAALMGAMGYAFNLFSRVVPYDELTHSFTTFSVSLAFYFLFYGGAVPHQRTVAIATSVFTLGVTVGTFWEIFEWVIGNRYGMADTISDLVVDSIGAFVAALVALLIRRHGGRLT